MHRRRARLELPGKVFDAAPGPGQREYLLPEFRRVRVPRFRHQDTLERSIRPIALGRKNHLFAGSDGGARTWAILAPVIQSAKLNGVAPIAYLKDILKRMVQGHPINRIDDLFPWNYANFLAEAA